MLEKNYDFKINGNERIALSLEDGVFVPTGTTKSLVKAVSSYLSEPVKTLDLGCGCGVVGITLYKLGLVLPPLYASDLSAEAIVVLEKNARAYDCPIIAKSGSLFEPWHGQKFNCIVDDVSGVSEGVAKISPWFDGVPCSSGADGTELVTEVIREAKAYLMPKGVLFFPVVSFSNVDKIIDTARDNFSHIQRLGHEEWPLPKEMYKYLPTLKKLRQEGCIQFMEKFGMVLWFTDIYVAYNG